MISLFSGSTADEVWQQLASAIQESRHVRNQDSRGGPTNELLHVALSIEDPRQRWVTSRLPAINFPFALAEVVWIMSGRRDLRFLQFWNRGLSKFVGPGPEIHGAYGHRLRTHLGMDQLKRAYQVLLHNTDSRQVVLQYWDSSIDSARGDGIPSAQDIPCNVASMLKVRRGKLEWTQVVRSHDLFLGVPYNFVQFTSMQEVLAGWLGIECGAYSQYSDSLHVYDRDAMNVASSLENQPSRVTPNTDCLKLSFEESDWAFGELERRIELLVNPSVVTKDIHKLCEWGEAPKAYQNILNVLVAESVRRRGESGTASEIVSRCNNSAYKLLWDKWTSRVSAPVPQGQHQWTARLA